jgi:uncharacterized protein
MVSGLLALLDDVVALAKVAAASLDDVAGQVVKASGDRPPSSGPTAMLV